MNAMPSATSFSREVISPATNGFGFGMSAYRFQQTLTAVNGTVATLNNTAQWPQIGQSSQVGASSGYGIALYPAVQQDPAISSMTSNYLDVRTVACSARIQCTLPALTAQGFVHIACVPEDLASGPLYPYPTTLAAMERAPFYQKLPLANLINNTPTIALPIMDEGAWRYRTTSLAPAQIGQSFVSTAGGSGANVQMVITGTGTTAVGAITTVGLPPFVSPPAVVAQITGDTNGASEAEAEVYGITNNSFTIISPTLTNAFPPSDQAWGFDYTAIGYMTAANAAAYYSGAGVGAPLTTSSFGSTIIPGIETTYGWGVLIIALENTGTTNGISPIEVEIIRHYEAIPSDSLGTVVTGTKAAPNCPEVLTVNKAVQDANGPISVLPDSGLDTDNDSGFVAAFQDAARWVSGVTGMVGSFHPALGVISGVTGAMGSANLNRGTKRRRV